MENADVAVIVAYGLSTTVSDTGTSTANVGTYDLDIPAGGFAVALMKNDNGSHSATWAGLVEIYDTQDVNSNDISGAIGTFNSTQTNLTISCTWSGTPTRPLYVVASFGVSSTNYPLTASQGSYTLTGQNTLFSVGHTIIASLGSYVLTGFDSIFYKGKLLIAEFGSYVLTGQNSLFHVTLSMLAGYASYALTGFDTIFGRARTLLASVGSYAYTGFTSVLSKGVSLIASQGSYTLTGQTSLLIRGKNLLASVGLYVYRGFSAKFPIYWDNTNKNTETWVNRTKNVETFTNTDKTNI